MKNLAMSQVVTVQFLDAPGHFNGWINDEATRKQIFQWIEKNEKFSTRRACRCILWVCISRPRVETMIPVDSCRRTAGF